MDPLKQTPRFKRSKRVKSKADARGKVVVSIVLRNVATNVKGNRSYSVTLADAKTSEVHTAICKALLGEKP